MTAKLSLVSLALLALMFKPDVESGPAAGEKPAALKVQGITGALAGKEADAAAERGEQPTIYLLVSSERFSRPLARFMKKLDTDIGQTAEKGRIVAVWLTADKTQSAEYLPKLQQSLQFERTDLTVSTGAAAGPEGWGVNDQAHVTAVAVRGGKVTGSFGYVSANDTVAAEVLAALKEPAK